MKQLNVKKLVLLNLPYFLLGLFATNLGEAWHPAGGAGELVAQPAPTGFAGGALLRRWLAAGGVPERQER